jgi:hypothetical protein
VIPIPGAFVSLKEADPKLFDMYRLCSQPSVRYVGEAEDSGCGCTKSKSDAGGNLSDTATRDVTIVAEGFTGDYEYTVLEATSTKGLVNWLDEHGWSTMGADGALDAYVAAGGFQFVSIALTPTVSETPEQGRELPPLRIRYDGSDLRYPAMMARVAMDLTRSGRASRRGRGARDRKTAGAPTRSARPCAGRVGRTSVRKPLARFGGAHAGFGIVDAGTCRRRHVRDAFRIADGAERAHGGRRSRSMAHDRAADDHRCRQRGRIDTGEWLFVPPGLAWKVAGADMHVESSACRDRRVAKAGRGNWRRPRAAARDPRWPP